MAIKLTENTDESVDTEEDMDFGYLTITGSYSDDDILEEEKETISKNDEVWVKTKKELWRDREYCYFFIVKKEYSEHLNIKWTNSGKKIYNSYQESFAKLLQKYFWCLLNSTLMVQTWRKISMISPLKSEKERNQ